MVSRLRLVQGFSAGRSAGGPELVLGAGVAEAMGKPYRAPAICLVT